MRRTWSTFVVVGCLLAWTGVTYAGDVFYVSNDNRVSRVEDGVVSTVATGRGLPNGLAMDRAGNLFVADAGNHTVWKLTPDGTTSTVITLTQENPTSVAIDRDGNLYVSTLKFGRVYKVTPAGVKSTVSAGTLKVPYDVTFDSAGNLYIANFGTVGPDGSITKVTPAGNVSVLASNLDHPDGMTFDAAGNLYVALFADNGPAGSIARISPTGQVTKFASVDSPTDVTFASDGDLYVTSHRISTLSRVSPDGQVTFVTDGLEAARSVIRVPEPAAAILLLPILFTCRRGRARFR